MSPDLLFGIYCSNFGFLSEPRVLVDLACRAEAAGWDGFFLYDHIVVIAGKATRSVDPWTVLAVVADRTSLVLGPMITPVPRRQPWELAHQAVALDRLSDGRLILGVGLGEGADHNAFRNGARPSYRGDLLDEGLGLLQRFWTGEPVHHVGHWRVNGAAIRPTPVRGRIPIWVAGRFPAERPMMRAAAYDGAFPINAVWGLDDLLRPDQLRTMVAVVERERGTMNGFDVITAGVSPLDPDSAGATVAPHVEAGATWWLEIIEPRRGGLGALIERVEAGPPSVDNARRGTVR